MPEKILNNPLSGAEIIEAVVDRVRASLQRDCFLTPTTAYGHFRAEIGLDVVMYDAGRTPEVHQTIVVTDGPIPETGEAEHFIDQIEMEPAPPNDVRVESGQAVPVLTTDEQGRKVEKGIRYGRKKAVHGQKEAVLGNRK